MILLVHMLFGAAIGSAVKNVPLAIFLAFLGHYFLDFFPHIEYPIPNIKDEIWNKALYDILKVFLDFCLGVLIIFIFSKNQPIIYLCAIVTIIPDGLTIINKVFPNKFLALHNKIHTEKIHYFKYHGLQDAFELFGFNFKTRQSEKSEAYAKHSGEPFFAKPQLKLKTKSQNMHLATHGTNKKISNFWRIATQVLAVIISIILLII